MNKQFTASLATQLTITLIGVVTISLFITGGLLIYGSVQSQIGQLQLTQQARAQVAAEKIDAYVDDLQRKLSYLARVRGLATFDRATQHSLLEALLNQNKAYELVGLTDRQGHLQQGLSPFNQPIEQEWAATIAFRRAVQEQEDFVGLVELPNPRSLPTLMLAMPIRDQQNNVGGMLFARINLKFLWAVLEETDVGETGYVYVLDQRQFVIAESRSLPEQFVFQDITQRPLGAILDPATHTPVQPYRGLHDLDVLGTSVRVAATNWRVVVELPLTEAYAPLVPLLGVMGAGLLLGLLFAAGFGSLLARQMTMPLQQLTRAATRLRFGELQTRVDIAQTNELRILADAFNHMAEQLGATITQLRSSEENLAITLHSIGDAVIATDAEGRITRMNVAAERMTSWPLEEARDQPLTDVFRIVHAQTRQPSVNPVQLVMERGQTVGLANHTALIARDRQEYQIADSAAPIRNAEGQIVGVVLVFSDVTERYQAEAALRESEAFNTAVLDSLVEHIAVLDQDGLIMAVNRNWRQFAERNGAPELAEHSVGLNYLAICAQASGGAAGEDAAAALQGIRAVLAGEQDTFSLEYPCHSPDEQRWFRLNVTPLRGTRRGAVISHENITARKQMEEQLKQQGIWAQFTSDAVITTDLDTHIISWNEAATRLYGWDATETIGKRMDTLLKTEFIATSQQQAHAILTQTGLWQGQIQQQTKSGQLIDIDVAMTFLKDNTGTITGGITINRDITDRKRAEEEKSKLEVQLYQAQKMESVGRLAGGVAHDFNNMLGVILGHAELALEETDLAFPLQDALGEIQKAAERSANLTRQLLTFARKQTVVPKILDLNETVTGMLKMLERMIGENIVLTWRPAADLWPIKVDPTQIDQILANLCVNARDAILDVGKITIETGNRSFTAEDDIDNADCVPGNYVLLSVSDTGCGMDAKTQKHIFEPFFTTKAPGHGTGLGLATVYGIVKQNNGFINVVSELNHGTTFQIYLPQYIDTDVHVYEEHPSSALTGGSDTILLVEDEPALLHLVRSMLVQLGYQVFAVETPYAAIQCCKAYEGEIHMLITDIVMPEINGWELARQLLAFQPRLKLLFMSGYTAEIIARHGVLEEGVSFIQKPFSLKDLAAKVRDVRSQ